MCKDTTNLQTVPNLYVLVKSTHCKYIPTLFLGRISKQPRKQDCLALLKIQTNNFTASLFQACLHLTRSIPLITEATPLRTSPLRCGQRNLNYGNLHKWGRYLHNMKLNLFRKENFLLLHSSNYCLMN